MAVTQESNDSSAKSVEESTQHRDGEGAHPGPCRLIRTTKADGPSTRPKGIKKDDYGTFRSHKLVGNIIKASKSDRLADIEIFGYLNTKEEVHRKRILWEAMNDNYMKAKKQKQAADKSKARPVKKATKTSEKIKPKMHSSRLNYDALKSLNDDLHESSESAQETQESRHGNISHVLHGSKESRCEEDGDHRDISYEDETDYQYGDEDFYGEFDT